jgi:hypothetical protein
MAGEVPAGDVAVTLETTASGKYPLRQSTQ